MPPAPGRRERKGRRSPQGPRATLPEAQLLPSKDLLKNELEEAALEEAPVLREQFKKVRSLLVREGAEHTALSGSGSTYFGLFRDRPGAVRARSALRARGFEAFASRTLTLERYRQSFSRALAKAGGNLRGT